MRGAFVLVAAALAAAASGCASDPCDGQSGVCLSITVKGTATGLDHLLVSVDRPTPQTKQTPQTTQAFNLPIAFALTLPAGTTGHVAIALDGLGNGRELAHTSQDVTLPASGRESLTFTLNAGTGVTPDMSLPDMAPPVDMTRPITLAVSGATMGIELEPLTITLTATDPAGGSVTFSSGTPSTLPTGATLTPNGNVATLAWTPGFDQAGKYPLTITATATDGTRSATQPLMLTIANGADPVYPMAPNDVVSASLPANIIGDFDKDGFADVASCSVTVNGNSQYQVDILYGDATGLPTTNMAPAARRKTYTLTNAPPSTANTRLGCVGADVDADGFSDVIIRDPKTNGGKGQLIIFYGTLRTNSTTQPAFAIDPTSLAAAEALGANPLVVGDFNGDKVTDFATQTTPGTNDNVYIFEGLMPRPNSTYFGATAPAAGQATLVLSTVANPACGPRTVQAFGDVDGMGKQALLLADPNLGSTGSCPTTPGGVTLLRASGSNVNAQRPSSSASGFGLLASLCDVDGDGLYDFAASDLASGAGYIFYSPLTLSSGILVDSAAVKIAPAASRKYSTVVCAPKMFGAASLLLVDKATTPVRVDVIGDARPAAVARALPNPMGDMHFGESTGSIGDVNGDGKIDLLVGTLSGQYWVIYGR
jgi:hypothetical protein